MPSKSSIARPGEIKMSTDSTQGEAPHTTDRVTRWLLVAVGVYSILLVGALNLIVLNSGKVKDRAIFLMADGMILLWIIVGGSITPILQRRLGLGLPQSPLGGGCVSSFSPRSWP